MGRFEGKETESEQSGMRLAGRNCANGQEG